MAVSPFVRFWTVCSKAFAKHRDGMVTSHYAPSSTAERKKITPVPNTRSVRRAAASS
jgi:hypothetical protein